MKNVKLLYKHALSTAKHELHRHPSIKFLLVFTVLIVYTILTSLKFGAREGLLIGALTWSFFVLCTPVADAGFLLDLPLRLFTGIRMVYSEIIVWVMAIGINIFTTIFFKGIYDDTILLSLFSHIIHQPFPYWSIIFLSGLGTFFSIIFGDEILDVALYGKKKCKHHKKHHKKHHLIILIFLVILVLILYDFLLNSLGVHIPLF